ncbi:hypothetical protein NQD34_005800 [Periophthalmus magnuspinnatus]|nr:hypothetical protein NQD34_005800 [Periophthalmus magnuspinnatus]
MALSQFSRHTQKARPTSPLRHHLDRNILHHPLSTSVSILQRLVLAEAVILADVGRFVRAKCGTGAVKSVGKITYTKFERHFFFYGDAILCRLVPCVRLVWTRKLQDGLGFVML